MCMCTPTRAEKPVVHLSEAGGAAVGLGAGRLLMLVQVGFERKRLPAPPAPEVLGWRVRLQVGAQVAPVRE